MVSLTRFLVAAASTLFGLPMAFASDSFTTAKPKLPCTEVTVSTPKTTPNFTRTDKGPHKESLFQGGFPAQGGTNPTVSVVFGPSFEDETFTAKIHSAVDFQTVYIAYTKRDEVEQAQPYKAYYAVKPQEFCAVTGSEKWKEIVAVSTFQEAK